MKKNEFHSFCRLVDTMHDSQQQSYKLYNSDRNLVAKCKSIESKVSLKLCDFKSNTERFYTWQDDFIHIVKLVRSNQELYYQTRYESHKNKAKEYESKLGDMLNIIRREAPYVLSDQNTQISLL